VLEQSQDLLCGLYGVFLWLNHLIFFGLLCSKRVTSSLDQIQQQVGVLLADRRMGGQALTFNYFSDCAEQILIATEWLQRIDEVALQAVASSSLSTNIDVRPQTAFESGGPSANICDYQDKLRKYNQEAEELVTAAVQNTIPRDEIGTRIKALIKQVDQDKVVYKIRKQLDVVSKLDQVTQYISASSGVIDANKGLVKGTSVSVATVDELEAQMFAIIDELNRLEAVLASSSSSSIGSASASSTSSSNSSPPSAAATASAPAPAIFALASAPTLEDEPPPPYRAPEGTEEVPPPPPYGAKVDGANLAEDVRKLQAKFETFAKGLATLRGQLEKEKDQANTQSLHRVADMQENFADLEYRFSSRFQSVLSAAGTFHEMLKSKQVKEARKNHLIAESNLFDL